MSLWTSLKKDRVFASFKFWIFWMKNFSYLLVNFHMVLGALMYSRYIKNYVVRIRILFCDAFSLLSLSWKHFSFICWPLDMVIVGMDLVVRCTSCWIGCYTTSLRYLNWLLLIPAENVFLVIVPFADVKQILHDLCFIGIMNLSKNSWCWTSLHHVVWKHIVDLLM